MIDRKFITELSTKLQTSEQNIAREYCQHLFLSYLYKKKLSENLLFKGGTALRIVFNSPRFSEDLDFSALNDLSIEDINNLIDAVLIDLKKEGIDCIKTVNTGTQGETTGGYYAVVNLKLLEFDSEIRVQISFRSKDAMQSSSALITNDFIPAYSITYLKEEILVREKVLALTDRAKPRDFFDLYFILKDRRLLSFFPREIPDIKSKIQEILNNGWEKELKVFLPISYHALLKGLKERLEELIDIHI